MNVFELAPYSGSKDYGRLAEMVKTHSIICILNRDGCRELASTTYSCRGASECWTVSAPGIAYLHAFDESEFVALCERSQLEFIEPPQ